MSDNLNETAGALAEIADAEKPKPRHEDLPDRYEVGLLLAGAIEESHEKITNGRIRDRKNEKTRQSWHRVLIKAASEYRRLLNDLEMEEMEERLEALESTDTRSPELMD